MTVVDINDVGGLVVAVADDTVEVVLAADSIEVVALPDETVEVVLAADRITVVGTDAVGPPGPPGSASAVPGPPGATGPAGPGAVQRFYGPGPPGTVVGAHPNDEYVDTVTGDLYVLF